LDFSSLPEFLKPKLRVFLSADLVGSSKFKNSRLTADETEKSDLSEMWIGALNHFYRQIESQFSREWNAIKSLHEDKSSIKLGSDPELWKANGDELIYVKVLTGSIEALVLVHCWLNTVLHVRQELRKYQGLDIKATAWTAGFPVRNREIIFQENSYIKDDLKDEISSDYSSNYLLNKWYDEGRDGLIRDFVGPSIDAGFRIASLSTPRDFMISIELAYILSSLSPVDISGGGVEEGSVGDFVFRYHQRKELKGILGGKPYPIFSIDVLCEDETLQLEDEMSPMKKVEPAKVREFSKRFINENRALITRPFILGCDQINFSEKNMPNEYKKELEGRKELWQNQKNKTESESKSFLDNEDADLVSSEVVDEKEVEEFAKNSLEAGGN